MESPKRRRRRGPAYVPIVEWGGPKGYSVRVPTTLTYPDDSPPIRVEFHSHTRYSKDSLTSPKNLLQEMIDKKIDRIVITDHNTIAGALEAAHWAPKRVVIGEEIMTTQGELIGVYVKETIPPGLTPEETISRLRRQGAFVTVPHPFDRRRSGHWEREDLLAILPKVDAIETFNARSLTADANRQAKELAQEYHLLETVGSDAHASFELGAATLLLPEFWDRDSLKKSLAKAEQRVEPLPMWVHLMSRIAVLTRLFRPMPQG